MASGVCHESTVSARVAFIITPYEPDAAGRMVPMRPDEGPCSGADGHGCQLQWHSWRERVSGPTFPLRVAYCRRHQHWFTLYPPGYAPYLRSALAPVSADGSPLQGLAPGAAGHGGALFEAALDAGARLAWPRDCPGGSDRWWGTQCRRLARATRLCGVAAELSESEREAIADTLGVDGLLLREWAGALSGATAGYRVRGQAVCAVLDALGAGPGAVDRLGEAGFLLGLWGAPLRWDPRARVLRGRAFRWSRTRGPPGGACSSGDTQ